MDILTEIGVVLGMIDAELTLIDKELNHPERFTKASGDWPVFKWAGSKNDLLELAVALHKAGLIRKNTGEEMPLVEIVAGLEQRFGVKILQPYERKSRLMARKKTQFVLIEKLRLALEEELKKTYQ